MISFACPYRLAFHHISALIPDISGIWEILSEFCVILGTDVSTFPLWTLEKPLVLEVVFGSFLGPMGEDRQVEVVVRVVWAIRILSSKQRKEARTPEFWWQEDEYMPLWLEYKHLGVGLQEIIVWRLWGIRGIPLCAVGRAMDIANFHECSILQHLL